jgi:hypothetical protein
MITGLSAPLFSAKVRVGLIISLVFLAAASAFYVYEQQRQATLQAARADFTEAVNADAARAERTLEIAVRATEAWERDLQASQQATKSRAVAISALRSQLREIQGTLQRLPAKLPDLATIEEEVRNQYDLSPKVPLTSASARRRLLAMQEQVTTLQDRFTPAPERLEDLVNHQKSLLAAEKAAEKAAAIQLARATQARQDEELRRAAALQRRLQPKPTFTVVRRIESFRPYPYYHPSSFFYPSGSRCYDRTSWHRRHYREHPQSGLNIGLVFR